MRFATVSEVPTPWLCLQEDLRQAGLDPERLDRVPDRSMAENLEALRQGTIEAAQLFEPFVEQALGSQTGSPLAGCQLSRPHDVHGLCRNPQPAR